MNNGIIQTALTGVPLELQYRPHAVDAASSTISEPSEYSVLSSQRYEATLSDEFEILLSAI